MTGFVTYVMVGGMTSASTTGSHLCFASSLILAPVAAAVSASVGVVGGAVIWLTWYLLNLYALPIILIGGVCSSFAVMNRNPSQTCGFLMACQAMATQLGSSLVDI